MIGGNGSHQPPGAPQTLQDLGRMLKTLVFDPDVCFAEFGEHRIPYILAWIGEFRPGNKTMWVVFDEESDVL